MPDEVVTLPPGAVEGKPGVTVVTNENFEAFVTDKLGPPAGTQEANEDPEAAATKEAAEIEAQQAAEKAKAAEPKEGDEKEGKVWFKGKWTGKHDFNYRLHLKTEEANSAAQAKIEAAAAEARVAREEREAIQRERDALKAKYEPPPAADLGPEPQPSQFTDITEYTKALKDWTAESTRRGDAAKQAEQQAVKDREASAKRWNEAQQAVQTEIPDYAEKINASAVKVSDQMRDAIIESEVGPKLLYHLAEHPEVAEQLGKMTVRKMLVELGKIEATLGGAAKPPAKSEPKLVEVSKAPAPISPLRGSGAPVGVKIDGEGKWTGSYEEYKAARLAGKIK